MSGETKKKVVRGIKLTPEENDALRRDAYRHEMNVSEYVRHLIGKERSEPSDKNRG